MLTWIKARLRDYFGFTSAETNGTLLLLVLITTCLLLPQGLRYYYATQPEPNHEQDLALLEHTLAALEAQREQPRAQPTPTKTPQQARPFDVNTADAAQLRTVRGIGKILSARIVKFRDKLGGFVHTAQYAEVYGLKPEVVERLKKHTYIHADFRPKPLEVNTADAEHLAAHPYLTHAQARNIVHYRAQHGPFTTAEDLKAVFLVDEEILEKIKPYVELR